MMATEGNSEIESDTTILLSTSSHHNISSATSSSDIKTIVWKNHRCIYILRRWWRILIIIGAPILLSPIPLSLHTTGARAAYCIGIIAIYWATEALPIALTALMPLWLFPALGVLSAKDTAQNYLNDTNMLFVGGLMVAVAIEKWNLHKRIALVILLAVGTKPRWLLLGFMITTAFLSMWISNTATAAMMLSIAHAVLRELMGESHHMYSHVGGDGDETLQSTAKVIYSKRESEDDDIGEVKEKVTIELNNNNRVTGVNGGENESLLKTRNEEDDNISNDEKMINPSLHRMSKVLMLGVAYAANIGGTATLTGTGPNIVLSGLSVSLFPEYGGINFGLWFVFAAPAMVVALLLSWLYLSLLYCDDSFVWCKKCIFKRVHSFHSERANKVIKEQYKKLGKTKYAEVVVLLLFALLAVLWLFREPHFIPGWASIFSSENGESYFSDASTVMFIVFLMFVIPSQSPWSSGGSDQKRDTLLDWRTVQSKVAWNIVLLLGSGFALSAGAKESGLSMWIGSQLLSLRRLPNSVIALCVSIIMAGVTEVMSNVATTTLFLPVLAEMGVELRTNPLYFMLPATVSASYAFMLPVATPPNAMAFSYGYLKVYDMVLTGVLMNIMCVGIVTLFLNTTGRLIFDLEHYPSWAGNITTDPVCIQWSTLNISTITS